MNGEPGKANADSMRKSIAPAGWKTFLRKFAAWFLLLCVLYLLRHLFPVIFLTFILGYIGNGLVKKIERVIRYRRLSLTLIYFLFLGLLILIVGTVIPRIYDEARALAQHYITAPLTSSAEASGPSGDVTEPPSTMPELSIPTPPLLSAGGKTIPESETFALAESVDTKSLSPEEWVLVSRVGETLDEYGPRILGAEGYANFRKSEAFKQMLGNVEEWLLALVPKIAENVRDFANAVLGLIFQFFLAILFSFLILWDLQCLKDMVRALERGRFSGWYAEVAPGIASFAGMLGRAFEAQSLIALVNALLTTVGFFFLGLPSLELLAVIVFFCSYVPVLGVILSTLPAVLLALKVGGVMKVVWVIAIVLLVHAVEAYGLNPLIYGHHMRMHPVVVLVVLLIGEHLFGIWGLLLAVPVAAWIAQLVTGNGEERELFDEGGGATEEAEGAG